MSSVPNDTDDVQLLLLHCGEILKEARFILSSIPNADESSVERILRKMHAVHQILAGLDDPWITKADIDGLIALVLDVSGPLQKWLDTPRPSYQPPQCPKTPGRGRPRFDIDLDRATELHDMELSWEQISSSMGISRRTLYYHFAAAGRPTARRPFTDITEDDLNEIVADIAHRHPLSGSVVVRGHLESLDIHIPLNRVKESLQTIDAIGVSLRCVYPYYAATANSMSLQIFSDRWSAAIKRRVYKVRGSNALWHHDGNEKLRPWGFYVHGCIDGHSRLIIFLKCSNNKKARTVERFFMTAVGVYGWPSRTRGDFGTENNGVERQMNLKWGELHRAYLRGR